MAKVSKSNTVVEPEVPEVEPEVEPEVTVPEPEVQEPEVPEVEPVVEPEPEVPVAETPLTYTEVNELLKNGSTSILSKLKLIANKANPELRTIASKLLDFEAVLGEGSINHGGDYIVSKCYDLNLILMSVVNTPDKNKFKTKQDILTLAFVAFKDSSMRQLKLLAYDYLWKFGTKELATYQNLVVLMTELSDLSTRENVKGKFSINKIMLNTTLSEHARNNLVSYYQL